ncbi:LacI family DNA-binding transcriptional regulator [Lentisphaerota bacterium ZTH]|nr:LacI family DNA-binding transcriptional regulator [Lentisphaerota bacterium]WET06308.1 LacI family DNA-binding transcriptional regulator [Lentisphaerota bacterium ZTH]
MPEKTKKITLKDIAARAGVSLTAASMYINGKAKKYHLADATCERIKKAVEDLDYVPNIHARAIASKCTLLLGTIISSRIESSFWLNILSGIEETITRDNYHMILSVSREDAVNELASIKFMLNKGIDGLLISPVVGSSNNHDYLRKLQSRLPVVTINQCIEGVPGAFNDNYAGGAMAAECLFEKGHKRIAYIGNVEVPRAAACKDFCAAHGIELHFFETVKDFLKKHKYFTGVFCFSDYVALELYNRAPENHIKIPEDISVIGYDDMEFTQYTRPRLSTIRQHKKIIGTAAAESIVCLLKNKKLNDIHKVFPPELVAGKSVAYL